MTKLGNMIFCSPAAGRRCTISFIKTAADISENQIAQAALSEGMKIEYYAVPAEKLAFPDESFDAITACQCFWHFDHAQIMPKLFRMLKSNGSLLVLCMAWLPFEDEIAGASERLVLKYNPSWSGAGEPMPPIEIPACHTEKFDLVYHDEYSLQVPFPRGSWNGRMKARRGTGASLTSAEILAWEQEHKKLLEQIAPMEFNIRHYAAAAELKARK